MGQCGPARTARDWRRRIEGAARFDPVAAEEAVRRVYGAGGLPAPRDILWVDGPREAAQSIAFLRTPPRRLLRCALIILVLGAFAATTLAMTADAADHGSQSLATASILSAFLVWWGLTLGGWYWLPAPPGRRPGRFDVGPLLPTIVTPLFFAGSLFLLKDFDRIPVEPGTRLGTLAVVAFVGALPGTFLSLRIWRRYRHLPRSLFRLAPSRSVAQDLERRRDEAWAPVKNLTIGPRPHRSLFDAYDIAYRDAFARMRSPVGTFDGRLGAPGAAFDIGVHWPAAGAARFRRPENFRGVFRHLDGIADSARAASVDRMRNSNKAASFADLAFHVDRLFPLAAAAVAVRPPTAITLDAEGRPHAEGGPALAWADGTHIYAWHGQVVAPELLDPEIPVTRWRIDHESDPGRRAVLIERYGLGRYLLEAGAVEVHSDDCGRLYRLEQRRSEPIVAVRVTNHTPEADGSVREFWLRVPPTMATARAAVAWTFGLSPEEYYPVAQS